ncbi:YlxR family protein [Frankia sp. AgB1.9]|uniref:YlxR family protein n=1 Tax=unclassified Frankia TaxID=2632575 RepID=UPI0019320968|nr:MULTISPECIES: YlxR family protein [unclassified Frankia]MBL7488976.1 YlxR family protein [Frankia sp. AgW1.1]MBL7546854.1 YlxR family protein [Frankia sp. AgB1.9]MBL7622524.1 YlxR family protein [Frankia sp. AgB1.8]
MARRGEQELAGTSGGRTATGEGTSVGKSAVRTCVGCRSRAARSDLLRIVVVDGELLPDVRRRLPGRGAHLHPDLTCLDLAERRRAFPRALRVPGPLGSERVRAHVQQIPRPNRDEDEPGRC